MVGESRRRLTVALTGAIAAVGGIVIPLSLAATTPAGASSVAPQVSGSGTSSLGSIVSDLEYDIENIPYTLGSYIQGTTQCPVSEVGYIIAGEPGPPPCSPGQVGG
jgi:hypothetical protein